MSVVHGKGVQPPGAFCIKDLMVEPLSGVVRGPGGVVHLEPRVMSVLAMLARTPGELVTRQALLAEIWPGGDIYDEALTQCVYQLRQQLVSAAGNNEFRELIRTVPKRGYLLQAGITPVATNAEAPAHPAAKRSWWPVALAVLALLVVTAFVIPRPWFNPDEPGPAQASIAVLPFLPLLSEQSNPALEQGMADTLIARLGDLANTVVRPISSVRQFDAPDRDSLAAGRLLGVDTVVDGSIQHAGEALRVTVRLLRVSDGKSLWADSFNESYSDIFSVQDAISLRVADALARRLEPQAGSEPASGTANTQAYELYLRGRYHLARLTRPDLLAAIELFNQAVNMDPGYAQAWLGLASTHFRIPLGSEGVPTEHFPLARQAAETALQIDPHLSEGHAFLGWVANWYDWDWAASEAHFKHAIEMNPDETEAHLGYAHLLSNVGRHEEALREIQRAREISPLFLAAAWLEGAFLQRAGQAEEAVRRMESLVTLDPGFWLGRLNLAQCYLAAGRIDDALAEIEEARRINNGTWAMTTHIIILVRAGRPADAQAILTDMRQRASERYVPPYDLALSHLVLGDLDGAWQWFQRAFEVREPKLTFLAFSPEWNVLSDRPGYGELVRSLNIPAPK